MTSAKQFFWQRLMLRSSKSLLAWGDQMKQTKSNQMLVFVFMEYVINVGRVALMLEMICVVV